MEFGCNNNCNNIEPPQQQHQQQEYAISNFTINSLNIGMESPIQSHQENILLDSEDDIMVFQLDKECEIPQHTGILSILDLPNEIILKILSCLDTIGIKNTLSVNSFLFGYRSENFLWKSICREAWGIEQQYKQYRFKKLVQSWRDYYDKKASLLTIDNGLCWIEIKGSGMGPSPRYQTTCDSVGKFIYFIGGQEKCSKRFAEIYKFDTETLLFEMVETKFSSPPKFSRHTSCVFGNKIFTHGGFDGYNENFNLCVFDTETNVWKYLTTGGDIPRSRTNHASASMDNLMYIYGGLYSSTNHIRDLVFLNDLYVLNTDTLIWTHIKPGGDIPPPKCGHKLFSFQDKLLLFGGGSGPNWEYKYNDVHIYDPITNLWKKIQTQGKMPVCTFTVSYKVNSFLFVYGGQSIEDNNLTHDLYMLDLISFVWYQINTDSNPHARDMASGCVVNNSLYLFGGYAGGPQDGFYELDLSSRFTDKNFLSTKPFS